MLRALLTTILLISSLHAGEQTFQPFEGDGFDTWTATGSAFGQAPVVGKTSEMENPFTNYANDSLVASMHGGEAATGTLTSPEFTLGKPYIGFLIAGGDEAGKTAAQLLIDDKVVREAVGKRSLICHSVLWDVRELNGRTAKIRIIDDAAGDWGFISVDHVIFSDSSNPTFSPTTQDEKEFLAGLMPTEVLPSVNIPLNSFLKIEATHEKEKITSPTALTFDEQGRIYVSETHRFIDGVEDDRHHLYWYLDDLAARKVSDRKELHEKWKEKVPLEKLTAKSEVVRRFSDTDGDGKIDEVKVFADQFNDLLDGTAAGVFFYEGSLYFSCIPKIWMLRDTNNDGVADERKVVEEGFGVRISFSGHDMNGFTLGPDGRIYGTIGDRGLSLITKEGIAYDYPNQGAAFRFEPDGTGFEIFHTGLRNPKEIAFDALGNAFTVDNNSDQGDKARIVYLVEGGDSGWEMEHQTMNTFHREIGLTHRPPNRWMDEKMWELPNSSQPSYILPPCAHLTSGPSGLTYHPGVGFLEKEAGRFLICDYRGGTANSGIRSFEMKPKGAGMELTDSHQLIWGVCATDVEYSWDGQIFITDFIEGWKTHQAGRLLSLNAGEKTWRKEEAASAARIIKEGFDQRSSAELANLLKHLDLRVRLRAQVALTRKSDALKRLVDAADSSIFNVRVHAIQGLGILVRRGSTPLPTPKPGFAPIPAAQNLEAAEKKLVSLLEDKNPEIRVLSLKALADSQTKPILQLGPLLADASNRVRFFAAILAGKQKMIENYGQVCDLLEENDNRDAYLRHAGVFALQGMATKPILLTGLSNHESPAVRLAAVIAMRRMKNVSMISFMEDDDPKVADEVIRALYDNGSAFQYGIIAELLDTVHKREWTPLMLRRLIHSAFRAGREEDFKRLLSVATDAKIPDNVREEALRLLSSWNEPFPVDQFTGHWKPLEKRDPKTTRPILTAALPDLLKRDDYVLTSALQWIDKYQLESPSLNLDTLRAIIQNTKLPVEARAIALDLLVASRPPDLTNFLTEITNDSSDDVSLSALAALAKLSPQTAVTLLEKVMNSNNISRIQKAWDILATLPGDAVDAIFEKKIDELSAAKGISPFAIELLAAAKKRTNPSIQNVLATFEKSLAESNDPLAKWNISLEGGNIDRGAALFSAHPAGQCMRCHRAADGHAVGGETAPNLLGIANRHKDNRYFLESIIQPSAAITPGFGAVVIDFKNGQSLSGNLIAETDTHLDINVANKPLRVLRSDIAAFTPPISSMPAMGEHLNPGEIRDLIAWLRSLNQGGEKPLKTETPAPFDPASLTVSNQSQKIDPALLKMGRQQFLLCGACHGQNGEGTSAAPPLAGSEWVNGPEENLIRIQLRGLQGPIKVKGQEYNFPAGMTAFAYQSDEQIAAVLTYIRNSFGNSAPPVTAAAVAVLRSEVGKPPVTAAELTSPFPVDTASHPEDVPASYSSVSSPGKYDQLKKESPVFKWIALALGGILLLGLIAKLALRKTK